MSRKCEMCGISLSEKDVMKVKAEDGSWDTFPLPVCPRCFKEQMRVLAASKLIYKKVIKTTKFISIKI